MYIGNNPVRGYVGDKTVISYAVGDVQYRSFRTNSGTTDYVQLASMVDLPNDFEVEMNFIPSVDRAHLLADTSSGGRYRIFYEDTFDGQANNKVELSFESVSVLFRNAVPVLGEINHLILGRAGTSYYCSLNGVQKYTGTANDLSFRFNSIMGKIGASTSVPAFPGAVFGVKVRSSGHLIHHWPMNEGRGGTHFDVAGGNHGTIINGQPEDWELFERGGAGD